MIADPDDLLTDAQWTAVEAALGERPVAIHRGRPASPDRDCFAAMLWVVHGGRRWRDLPRGSPHGTTCVRRIRQWAERGVLADMWSAYASLIPREDLFWWHNRLSWMDPTFGRWGLTSSLAPHLDPERLRKNLQNADLLRMLPRTGRLASLPAPANERR